MADAKKPESIVASAPKNEIPKTGVDVLRRLDASGTGKAKLHRGFEMINRWMQRTKTMPSAVEFLDVAATGYPETGDRMNPGIDPLPDMTLAKIRRLIETGSHEAPNTKSLADIEFAAKLESLELGQPVPTMLPPDPAVPQYKPRVQFVGEPA